MINAQTGDRSRQDPDSYLRDCCSVQSVNFQGLVAVTLKDRSIEDKGLQTQRNNAKNCIYRSAPKDSCC